MILEIVIIQLITMICISPLIWDAYKARPIKRRSKLLYSKHLKTWIIKGV